MQSENRVVVFDGFCNLCSSGARWLQEHPTQPPFRLVPMQSELGRALFTQHGCDPDDPLTFLALDGDRVFTQSDAWIHLVLAVGGAWRIVSVARVIPRPWRNAVYRLIARNRYRWFGRRQTCLFMPPVEADSATLGTTQERSGPHEAGSM
jgi:predicted DCC family thiol-disulfide oxidoreductase YuxK